MEKKIKVTEHLYLGQLRNNVNWLEANKLTSSIDESDVLMFKRSRNKNTDKINFKTREEKIKKKEYT